MEMATLFARLRVQKAFRIGHPAKQVHVPPQRLISLTGFFQIALIQTLYKRSA